jgi:hypothetical protein
MGRFTLPVAVFCETGSSSPRQRLLLTSLPSLPHSIKDRNWGLFPSRRSRSHCHSRNLGHGTGSSARRGGVVAASWQQ